MGAFHNRASERNSFPRVNRPTILSVSLGKSRGNETESSADRLEGNAKVARNRWLGKDLCAKTAHGPGRLRIGWSFRRAGRVDRVTHQQAFRERTGSKPVLWFWIGFNVFVLSMLALDLGVFHRKAHTVTFRESATWVGIWVALATVFGLAIPFFHEGGWKASIEFFTGYILEQSLSMDNVFVIALIFAYFRVPQEYQHRVLFWGIIGVLVMRGTMIGLGALLIAKYHWILYVFGAFLVYTGIKMALSDEDEEIEPEHNPVVRLVKKFIPVHPHFDGQNFTTRVNGKLMATPLLIVLVIVETTDLIFAVDSIPAIFAVTTDSFIVFTSNVFAVLGLRSLYFLLAGAMGLFRYLKLGLSIVLVFIGVKMLELQHHLLPHGHPVGVFLDDHKHTISLSAIVGILGISIAASLWASHRDKKLGIAPEEPPLSDDSPLMDKPEAG